MPFEDLETVTNENAAPTATLSYLRHIKKDNVAARSRVKPKLLITVPTAIFITKKERFMLQVGTGAQKGALRIKCVAKGVPGAVAKGTDFRNHVKLKFGYVTKLGDEIFDGMKCAFTRVDDDTYEIKIDLEALYAEDQKAPTIRKVAG
jgi:hypothetical protein